MVTGMLIPIGTKEDGSLINARCIFKGGKLYSSDIPLTEEQTIVINKFDPKIIYEQNADLDNPKKFR